MNLFLASSSDATNIVLNEEESKHCIKVLRMTKGDSIHVIDGKGSFFRATIVVDNPRQCIAKIDERKEAFGDHGYSLHIAIAPTKNISRFEWFLEKCTEIGINEITPILCERSERKIIKPQRLEKILLSATKQSLKSRIPVLHPLVKLPQFLKQMQGYTEDEKVQKFIAHCQDQKERKRLKQAYSTNEKVLILIGPEGDFTANEIQKTKTAGFSEISLGNSRLRTETAGLVACHTIHLANQ